MATGVAAVLMVASCVTGVRTALASFTDNDVQAASAFGAAPDWVAPMAGSTTIAKTSGYLAGSIKPGGPYYVYANVTDSGNPASGVAVGGESASVTSITPAGSAVPLVGGSYSVGGVAYNYRSAALVATTPLSGTKEYSLSSLDAAGNSRSQTGFTVSVDSTAPTASDIQTTNVSGGTVGRAQLGDRIVFTYSEQIDPESILSGWTGSTANTVVRLIDGGCTLVFCSDDSVTVWNATDGTQLPLGSVDLNRDDYHGGGLIGTRPPLTFGLSGTPSTMVRSGSTVTVTLGTASATPDTAGGDSVTTWTPANGAYDAAGNLGSTGAVNESGVSDREF